MVNMNKTITQLTVDITKIETTNKAPCTVVFNTTLPGFSVTLIYINCHLLYCTFIMRVIPRDFFR